MIYDELIKGISKDKVLMNENMNKHTSFKVGGMADFFVEVQNVQELIYVLKLAKSLRIKTCIIGNGSNVIVKDTGFRGIIVKLNFKHLKIEKDRIAVGAGVPVALLSEFTYRNGISGYEFLGGIPGTVGGAVKMNAGAYGSEIKDVLLETVILDEKYNIRKLTNEEQKFAYRHSIFFEKKWVIIASTFKIQKGNREEIKAKRKEMMDARKDKQPLDMPNAGSIFKRAENCIPAKLIDEAGLKGYTIGGAQISTKHAGFIVNTGNATAKDIVKLIKYTKEKVKEKFGVELELEVIVL